ncbi:hypothetical protein [Streptomyces synnematoformans]|uniref:Uncharacterized protein n=1 Tax=Streptomyces synnematoformans TaxID=415721 RepID=A0ABP5JR66_9ACTN
MEGNGLIALPHSREHIREGGFDDCRVLRPAGLRGIVRMVLTEPSGLLTIHQNSTGPLKVFRSRTRPGFDQSMVIAGAFMSVIPLIGVFLIGSRHFISNLAAGAMKF